MLERTEPAPLRSSEHRRTIVVCVSDGLGNQLFQYAAGRYYAEKHGARLRVGVRDAYAESYGHPRPILLSEFALEAPFQRLSKIDRLVRRVARAARPITQALRLEPSIEVVTEAVEQRFRFVPELSIRASAATVYLTGYWQAHQLAAAAGDELRREFTLRAAPTGKNADTLRLIERTSHAVSVHIRRGDYLLETAGSVALKMGYYRESIDRMRARFADATLFVFSDDMEFARANLPARAAVFVDQNDAFTAHEDLRLMSACRHHIIANSTFSWWGAWLNSRPDKTVFAPRDWLVGQSRSYADLFPPGWELV